MCKLGTGGRWHLSASTNSNSSALARHDLTPSAGRVAVLGSTFLTRCTYSSTIQNTDKDCIGKIFVYLHMVLIVYNLRLRVCAYRDLQNAANSNTSRRDTATNYACQTHTHANTHQHRVTGLRNDHSTRCFRLLLLVLLFVGRHNFHTQPNHPLSSLAH